MIEKYKYKVLAKGSKSLIIERQNKEDKSVIKFISHDNHNKCSIFCDFRENEFNILS